MTDGLPTACTTLRTGYVRLLVFCNSCRHQADADLQAISRGEPRSGATARHIGISRTLLPPVDSLS